MQHGRNNGKKMLAVCFCPGLVYCVVQSAALVQIVWFAVSLATSDPQERIVRHAFDSDHL